MVWRLMCERIFESVCAVGILSSRDPPRISLVLTFKLERI